MGIVSLHVSTCVLGCVVMATGAHRGEGEGEGPPANTDELAMVGS